MILKRIDPGLRGLPLLMLTLLLAMHPAHAASPARGAVNLEEKATGPVTGLPMPRFVSLKSATVNVRTGPGTRYPIRWTYTRKQLPVEIVDEHENWRQIRDVDGQGGWVNGALLDGRRSAQVRATLREPAPLRRAPVAESAILAHVQPYAVGRVESCTGQWCRTEWHLGERTHTGWIAQDALWGVYANEQVK